MLAIVEIHRELLDLVERAGADVFGGVESFCAACDDFIPEGAASRGEWNLLGDAIRLGEFRRFLDQLGLGAEPSAAVIVHGERLAAERGTTEAEGTRWALAALGYAVGQVDEAQVIALRAEMARGPTLATAPPLASTEAAPERGSESGGPTAPTIMPTARSAPMDGESSGSAAVDPEVSELSPASPTQQDAGAVDPSADRHSAVTQPAPGAPAAPRMMGQDASGVEDNLAARRPAAGSRVRPSRRHVVATGVGLLVLVLSAGWWLANHGEVRANREEGRKGLGRDGGPVLPFRVESNFELDAVPHAPSETPHMAWSQEMPANLPYADAWPLDGGDTFVVYQPGQSRGRALRLGVEGDRVWGDGGIEPITLVDVSAGLYFEAVPGVPDVPMEARSLTDGSLEWERARMYAMQRLAGDALLVQGLRPDLGCSRCSRRIDNLEVSFSRLPWCGRRRPSRFGRNCPHTS